MGLLDHSTNNILIDAVLTDVGRKAIADGDFNIAQYAFFDDEIDYTIIKKYGKTIGREKIEKNTPIFEASTSANTGMKHQLLTLEGNEFNQNSQIAQTPQDFFFLEASPGSLGSKINIVDGNPEAITINITLNKKTGTILNDYNAVFRLEYDGRFLEAVGSDTGEINVNNSFKKAAEYNGGGSTQTNVVSRLTVEVNRSEIYAQYSAAYSVNNEISVPIKIIETNTNISTTLVVKVTV